MKNQAAYNAWLTEHTPNDIRKANNARNHLKRLGVKGYTVHIKDDRLVKRPVSTLLLFSKDRHATGDFKGVKVVDAAKLIAREWRELPANEKQVGVFLPGCLY